MDKELFYSYNSLYCIRRTWSTFQNGEKTHCLALCYGCYIEGGHYVCLHLSGTSYILCSAITYKMKRVAPVQQP